MRLQHEKRAITVETHFWRTNLKQKKLWLKSKQWNSFPTFSSQETTSRNILQALPRGGFWGSGSVPIRTKIYSKFYGVGVYIFSPYQCLLQKWLHFCKTCDSNFSKLPSKVRICHAPNFSLPCCYTQLFSVVTSRILMLKWKHFEKKVYYRLF